MADDISKKLLAFALRNSNLINTAIEPNDIDNEIARNSNKLSLSVYSEESIAGKKLLKMTSNDGNKTSEAIIESKSDFARNNRNKRIRKSGFQSIKESLIKEWQSGQYRFKTDCANAKYVRLGMSYSTAIEYLRKIPKTKVN